MPDHRRSKRQKESHEKSQRVERKIKNKESTMLYAVESRGFKPPLERRFKRDKGVEMKNIL